MSLQYKAAMMMSLSRHTLYFQVPSYDLKSSTRGEIRRQAHLWASPGKPVFVGFDRNRSLIQTTYMRTQQ